MRFTFKHRSGRISYIQAAPVTLACERPFREIDEIIKLQKKTGARIFDYINHDSGTAFTQLATGKESKNRQRAVFWRFWIVGKPDIFLVKIKNQSEPLKSIKPKPRPQFQIYFKNRSFRISYIQAAPVTLACERPFQEMDEIIKEWVKYNSEDFLVRVLSSYSF